MFHDEPFWPFLKKGLYWPGVIYLCQPTEQILNHVALNIFCANMKLLILAWPILPSAPSRIFLAKKIENPTSNVPDFLPIFGKESDISLITGNSAAVRNYYAF